MKPILPLYWRVRADEKAYKDARANEWKIVASVWCCIYAFLVVIATLGTYFTLPVYLDASFLSVLYHAAVLLAVPFIPMGTITTFFVWLSLRS